MQIADILFVNRVNIYIKIYMKYIKLSQFLITYIVQFLVYPRLDTYLFHFANLSLWLGRSYPLLTLSWPHRLTVVSSPSLCQAVAAQDSLKGVREVVLRALADPRTECRCGRNRVLPSTAL